MGKVYLFHGQRRYHIDICIYTYFNIYIRLYIFSAIKETKETNIPGLLEKEKCKNPKNLEKTKETKKNNIPGLLEKEKCKSPKNLEKTKKNKKTKRTIFQDSWIFAFLLFQESWNIVFFVFCSFWFSQGFLDFCIFTFASSLLSLKTGFFQREVASREESSIWTNRPSVKQDFV